ncbi:hypothetical protein BUALT_Bualt12G0018300 [Buddleja alternifolia]|uniref:Uncharacterized protein n=1 Tax=Buddleja alternifolia TaxID=168488 RepID=A0AAV6WV34_9LAMI|nr:hypothetical protein BUALT_Bualt12G0018300 [Buddleja alternifolia]
MEDLTRRGRVDEWNLASRRAEEAALRRYQAVHWLDYLVGPLGIPSQPSEKEFISCLKSGLVLCNTINKIQPGSVPKVIESISPSPSLPWDSQPLPAYQYFENVRNFLVAAEELKLPIFEASIFERDNLEEGSSTKVVDCILALKAYHEWKQMTGGNGVYKPPRSPIVHSAGRIHGRTPGLVSYESSRKLDMSSGINKTTPSESEIRNIEDTIAKALAEHMVDAKENMDYNLVASYRSGNLDSANFFKKILSSCLEEELLKTYPEMKSSKIFDHLREISSSPMHSASVPLADLSNLKNRKCCRACLEKGSCNHWNLVEQQEKELLNIKVLLSSAKQEVETLQIQLQSDLKQLGDQVVEMSNAALGYHKAVQENRSLYNMVQDLKGNIRVYCRIRPAFKHEEENVIDFIGQDGCLVVVDPRKPEKDGKKMFQFNRIFSPTATQDEVFRDTQPLVRSVMDGYNVCIFAYGQTGSGKTHTMSGSAKELGISYLALNDLFEMSDKRKDVTKYEIQVQLVEIYNEQVRDLLAEDSGATKYPFHIVYFGFLTINTLEIRSCVSDNNLALPDATLCPVKSTVDIINLMKLGEQNRAVGSTAVNIQSSRSHSVLSVHVQGEDVSGSILRSCLHLVDLAGSERIDKSEVTGDGLREAQHINKSLSCLVDVMTALAQKNSHIPYRNSKLTLLLQNSLGGNAKTLMFAHVGPEGDSFGETMSTLKFAQRVSTVELGAARANKESSEVLELKAQIESLKKALGNKEVQTPPIRASKTPLENNTKQIPERTPPRPRRLSIENGIERGAKTSLVKPKQIPERTPPPRPRRLSIENSTTVPVERSMNYDDKRGAKTPPSMKPRSRRLSLEGPRNVQNHSRVEDGKSTSNKKDTIVSSMDLSNQRAPKSPLTSAIKSPVARIDTAAMRVPLAFQIPKTPEPHIKSRNDHNIVPSENQTPNTTTHGKGSQIRKSLRTTIGKLINGSDKRNQQKPTEATSTVFNNTGMIHVAKSPVSSNARTVRRQSLTGIQPPERSRRSSIGGVSTDSCGNENRNAKTPPSQVRASVKLTKRWL